MPDSRWGFLAAVAALVILSASACSDGGDNGTDDTPVATTSTTHAATPTVPAAPAGTPVASDTLAAEPTAAASPQDANREVQGIVGSIDARENMILINRLSGAQVKRVLVRSSTRIRDSQGRTLRLSQIRPSDRIVATGEIQGEDLIADEVTISQVVPGTSPG